MSRSTKTSRVVARVPPELADAVEQRAQELGVTGSQVVRDAVAREVSTPIDPRSRSYVAVWLAAQEAEV